MAYTFLDMNLPSGNQVPLEVCSAIQKYIPKKNTCAEYLAPIHPSIYSTLCGKKCNCFDYKIFHDILNPDYYDYVRFKCNHKISAYCPRCKREFVYTAKDTVCANICTCGTVDALPDILIQNPWHSCGDKTTCHYPYNTATNELNDYLEMYNE